MDAFEHNDGLCSWCVGVCVGVGVRMCVCARALSARARVPACVRVCLRVYYFLWPVDMFDMWLDLSMVRLCLILSPL